MKHLLSIADLNKDEIVGLLDEADRFHEALEGREVKKLPTLRGRTVFTLFYENSTRTRSSFETAGKWMSADVINLSTSTSSVKKGESLKDTGLTLSAVGADAIIIRHASSGAPQQLAGWVAPNGDGPSVINMRRWCTSAPYAGASRRRDYAPAPWHQGRQLLWAQGQDCG